MTCTACNNKSTLVATNTSSQPLGATSPITFNAFSTNGSAITVVGNNVVKITKPGIYYVSFSGVGIATATAGDVSVQLYRDGSPIPGILATEYSSATTDLVNLGFSTIVEVKKSCACVDNTAVLTILNIGTNATFTNAEVSIVKVG